MTDYEIWHEHIAPQLKRQEAEERAAKGLPQPVEDGEEEAEFVPTKQYMMSVLVGILGMSKEQAEVEYERQRQMNEELKRGKR